MSHPTDALHFREMFGRTMRGPNGAQQAFFVTPTFGEEFDEKTFEHTQNAVRRQVIQSIDYGETFYTSREITDLLVQAADRIEHKTVYHFEPDDFPALHGMVYIDGDVWLPTLYTKARQQRLRALIWGQYQHATTASPARTRPDDTQIAGKVVYTVTDSTDMARALGTGPWNLRHWLPIEYGVRMSPDMLLQPDPDQDPWTAAAWANMSPEQVEQDKEDHRVATEKVFRFMYVLFHFLKTEIIGRSTGEVDRSHIRVMGKENRPLPKFRILTLRRYAAGPHIEGGTEVHWSHRWLQRGHWRNQRVGPKRMLIRPVWIAPMIKGPADKPLIVRDTVQAIVR